MWVLPNKLTVRINSSDVLSYTIFFKAVALKWSLYLCSGAGVWHLEVSYSGMWIGGSSGATRGRAHRCSRRWSCAESSSDESVVLRRVDLGIQRSVQQPNVAFPNWTCPSAAFQLRVHGAWGAKFYNIKKHFGMVETREKLIHVRTTADRCYFTSTALFMFLCGSPNLQETLETLLHSYKTDLLSSVVLMYNFKLSIILQCSAKHWFHHCVLGFSFLCTVLIYIKLDHSCCTQFCCRVLFLK